MSNYAVVMRRRVSQIVRFVSMSHAYPTEACVFLLRCEGPQRDPKLMRPLTDTDLTGSYLTFGNGRVGHPRQSEAGVLGAVVEDLLLRTV